MAPDDITLQTCAEADREVLLSFMRAFCIEDGHPHGPANEAALDALIANPANGRAVLILLDGDPVGYAALCFGFSLEFGGRDAFLDEFYVAPEARGRGVASRALDLLVETCRGDGVRALHLEVMDGNERAAGLYGRRAWVARPSRLMTRILEPAG